MDKISIIIPVYKVEPYIKKCLDSVITQTHTNLEILLINDGSPDNCGEICDEYTIKDSRIKVFHKENGGLSSALNVGLEYASGDYIGFVDSDDWIEPDMFEHLLETIQCVDISICSYFKNIGDVTESISNIKNIPNDVIQTEQMLLYPLKRDYYMGFCGYVWNKLYRAEVIKRSGLQFDENIKYAMDILFYETLVTQEKCVGRYTSKQLYHYRQREGAITKSESFDVKIDILEVYKRVEELLPVEHKYWARGFYCYHASVILQLAFKKRNRTLFDFMKNEIRVHMQDYEQTNVEFPQKIERMKELVSLPFQ